MGLDTEKKITEEIINGKNFDAKYSNNGMRKRDYAPIKQKKKTHAKLAMDRMRAMIDAHKEEEARNSASESDSESEPEEPEEEIDHFAERRAALEARRQMLKEAEEALKKAME